MGYAEVTFSTNILNELWMPKTELTFIKGSQPNWSSFSWCLENSVHLPKEDLWNIETPVALFMQWYKGYGESLKSYNRKTNNFRFGLTLIL